MLKCDEKGRLYLRTDLRNRYGDKFVIVEAPDEIVLVPVPADPLKDFHELGGNLGKTSTKELKARIRSRARQEAKRDLR